MKFQFVIMLLIVVSLVSFFAADAESTMSTSLWGNFESAPFWVVFAIFFPAVTGIEAGAAMSGELKDPRKSLKIGILSSILISLLIYIGIAFWMDRLIPPDLLRSNYLIMADVSRWRWAVMAAILGATLSSALGSVVGGPRTLMALGQNNAIPFGKYFSLRSRNGEPRLAILFTGIIIYISLVFGDLNSIAPLLTMFFLIAYGTINLVVFIEKRIGITSYRPSFDIPLIVPAIGFIWSVSAMFLINPIFAAVSIVVIILIFLMQLHAGHKAPWGDVREGLFNALAEWAIRTGDKMPKSPKSWKPNLMVPVGDPNNWTDRIGFLNDLSFPKGSIRVFHVKVSDKSVSDKIKTLRGLLFGENIPPDSFDADNSDEIEDSLNELIQPLKELKILTAATLIEANDFIEGVSIATQSLRAMPLPPNVMFLNMGDDEKRDGRLKSLISIAIREEMGIILSNEHPEKQFGDRQSINLWLRKGSPNRNLTTLTALQLERNWDANLNLINVVKEDSEIGLAETALNVLTQRSRLPADSKRTVLVGEFMPLLSESPKADIHIFGLSEDLNIPILRNIAQRVEATCLFIRDSGAESALA